MEELLKLTRENNEMLKQIIVYLSNNGQNTFREFMINYLANKVADIY